jgi:hypothetical protein
MNKLSPKSILLLTWGVAVLVIGTVFVVVLDAVTQDSATISNTIANFQLSPQVWTGIGIGALLLLLFL